MKLTIEAAVAADIDDLVFLLGLLFAIEQDFSADPERQRRGLLQLIAHPEHAHVSIARDSAGQAVGMATAQLVISTAEGAQSAWIEDVVVAEEWRAHGVGRQLLDDVLAWARGMGATRAQLLVDVDNSPALSFYERMGWAATRLNARRLKL